MITQLIWTLLSTVGKRPLNFLALFTRISPQWVNTLRPRQNDHNFADNICECIFMPPRLRRRHYVFGLSVRPSVRLSGEVPGICRGMAWNFACWCIVTTFRTDYIMVTVYSFSSFWCHFDFVKRVKFGVSGHFQENAWREWAEILYADVSWPPSELISSWLRSVAFFNFGTILT